MSALALRAEPKSRETFYSFVGRLSAINGVSLQDFLKDFGLPKNKFFALDGGVIDAIAELAALSQAQVEELVTWTGLPQEGVRMAYRGEQIVSRAIRNPEVRGCIDCLRQDVDGAFDPRAAMAMRGHWLLRHSRVCLLHGKLLVPLWSVTRPAIRDDIQARLSEKSSLIDDGTITGAVVAPSAFDLWLDRRLELMTDDTWLGQHTLHVVATMCELVGHLIAQNEIAAGRLEKAVNLHCVYAMGFNCMIGGRASLECLFDQRLADRAPTDGPQKVFHPLHEKLGRTFLYDPDFDHFRDLIRERVLDTWPIAAGEKVLGVQLGKRRLHSIASLAADTGLDPGSLRRRLVAEGIVVTGDDRADGQVVFSANAAKSIAAEAAELVFQSDIRAQMGASEVQFDALVEEGLIAPRIKQTDMRRVWALHDGIALVAKLLRHARPIEADADGWEHVQDAARRFRTPLAAIFARIEDETLRAGRQPVIEGYGGLFIATAEVEQLFRNPQHVGLAPSAFGVSVGVKTKGAIQSLIDQGYMSVTEVTDARTGAVHSRVLGPDAIDFHARFRTWRTTTAETGISWRHLKTIFRDHGVEPVETPLGIVEGVFDKDVTLAATDAYLRSQGSGRQD